MSCRTEKKVEDFLIPSRDVTNQALLGREQFNNSQPGKFWLVTSRLGTGKTITFFTVQRASGQFDKLHDGSLLLVKCQRGMHTMLCVMPKKGQSGGGGAELCL